MFASLRTTSARSTTFTSTVTKAFRPFSTTYTLRMPEQLTAQEVNSKTDPSVAKQWDDDVSAEKKFGDFYAIADKLKIGLLGTLREGTGPVHRSMAVAKRTGPDFLFLANAHSQKVYLDKTG